MATKKATSGTKKAETVITAKETVEETPAKETTAVSEVKTEKAESEKKPG